MFTLFKKSSNLWLVTTLCFFELRMSIWRHGSIISRKSIVSSTPIKTLPHLHASTKTIWFTNNDAISTCTSFFKWLPRLPSTPTLIFIPKKAWFSGAIGQRMRLLPNPSSSIILELNFHSKWNIQSILYMFYADKELKILPNQVKGGKSIVTCVYDKKQL